jgi:hypothetical protein
MDGWIGRIRCFSFSIGRNARRMQNTILVVGPGTPASVVESAFEESKRRKNIATIQRSLGAAYDFSSSSSYSEVEGRSAPADDEEFAHEADEFNHDDVPVNHEHNQMHQENQDDSSRDSSRRRSRAFVGEDVSMDAMEDEEYEFLVGSDHDDEDDSEDSDDSVEEDFSRSSVRRDFPLNTTTVYPHFCPSMRHGGCINTAAWLDTGWSLSTVNRNDPLLSTVPIRGIATEECPTQLVTSGDDYLVKFWDVRDAMGMTSPLPGGRATICPFSASKSRSPQELEDEWQALSDDRQSSQISCSSGYEKRDQINFTQPSNDYHLPGSVRLLSTVHTGHRGNVFHVTPLSGKLGVVATCGADGFLRLTNIETGDSTVVTSPEFEDEVSRMLPIGLLSRRTAMNYSHHFITQNVGLLCSDRGLKRFDLRLSPREQSTERLVGGSDFQTCKACAVLSTPLSTPTQGESEEPSYVFGKKRTHRIAVVQRTRSSAWPYSFWFVFWI